MKPNEVGDIGWNIKTRHIMPPDASVISHCKPFHKLPCDYRLVTSQVGMST